MGLKQSSASQSISGQPGLWGETQSKPFSPCVLVRVSIAVTGHHDHRKVSNEKHLTGGLQFRGSVHYPHGGTSGVQADTGLER